MATSTMKQYKELIKDIDSLNKKSEMFEWTDEKVIDFAASAMEAAVSYYKKFCQAC